MRLTGRPQPNVSRFLQQLAGHGLVCPVRTPRVDLMTGTCEPEPAAAPA